MNLRTKVLTVLTAVTLMGSYGIALAAPSGMGGNDSEPPRGPGMRVPGGPMGSTTWRGGMGSTTWNGSGMRPGMREGSSTDPHGPDFRGIPGVVTELGSNQFLMDARGFGSATTTMTVDITNATVFNHGTTTAAFSDLAVGSRVVVMGTVATSTKTITATRVVFGLGEGGGYGMMHGGDAQPPKGLGGFMEKLRTLFGFGHGTTTAGGPAAAGSNGGFLNSVLRSVFGWMH